MGKSLVIVESPAKAKTINKMLGKDVMVMSSMGHVRDLPVKELGVDVAKGFKISYEVVKGRKKVVDELTAAAKECDAIYLAPDPDREGEAIAWHLKEILAKNKANAGKPFYRITYNEITPRAVKAAFDHPGEINMPRVDAQQARRVVDRIVGYKVSPLLWKRVQRGLSAGRVQSVALRLVCEREQEISAFKPEAYWVFGANVRKLVAPLDPFMIKLTKVDGEKASIHTAAEAQTVQTDLDGCAMKVAGIKTRMVNRQAYPPFITSTLQQAASTFCGFSPKRTMDIAQKLYEGVNVDGGASGLITYMRTDSVNLSQDALVACRAFIEKAYGAAYLPPSPNVYRSRGGAQEAHEAIRPTDVTLTPDRLKGVIDEPSLKLYRLIWERFVACQMPPARIEQRTVEVEAVPRAAAGSKHRYLLTATASDVKFDGHRRVTGEKDKKEDDSDQVEGMPMVKEGEPLALLELLSEQKETQPPSRFSEASLVKALEANGVGRPSTYAQILTTLQTREYVELKNRTLFPSDLGMKTSTFLTRELGQLFDVQFTADMESKLDTIEDGNVDWTKMLETFYTQFNGWMDGAKEPPADLGHVQALLDVFKTVRKWDPPVTRGKRTYSDETFVASVEEQLQEGSKPISARQLEVLSRLASRYREEATGVAEALRLCGAEALLDEPLPEPPRASSIEKLRILRGVALDDSTRKFVESLSEQVQNGRRLSPAQLGALDRMFVSNAAQISDFDARKDELGLTGQVAPAEDKESGELLAMMKHVTTWDEPVKRGKREFNDKTFYESLDTQYSQRKYLSERQQAALKKMVRRYRAQVPGYAEAEARLDLKPKPSTRGKRAEAGD
ncbi:MAG TPA: type I DNA topoisomerase [Verrucomicrobia bacterium]|nr:type I DNA topoisomerase [Verrucomicrobiota bacterium]